MAGVLGGGFSMETNHSPRAMTLDDLRAQMFGVGAELHRDLGAGKILRLVLAPRDESAGSLLVEILAARVRPDVPYRSRPHPLYPFEDPSPIANA